MFVNSDETALTPVSLSEYRCHLSAFGKDTKVTVTIESYRRHRSLKQLGLVHVYLTKIADYIGHEMEDVKTELKRRFGAKKTLTDRNGNELYDEETGEIIEVPKSFKEYNTEEMTLFIDRIRRFSHENLNYYLPSPDELKEYNIKW